MFREFVHEMVRLQAHVAGAPLPGRAELTLTDRRPDGAVSPSAADAGVLSPAAADARSQRLRDGQTRAVLAEFAERRRQGGGKALVLAPKSILVPTWAAELRQCFPQLRCAVAAANTRSKAFARDADLYIANVDAAKWCARHLAGDYWADFDTLILDESSAVKNPKTQRAEAIGTLIRRFPYRRLMSGTPCPNSISELWYQLYLLDGGERLGTSFVKFRQSVCTPVRMGLRREYVRWVDKPGSQAAVFERIADISIRHRFDDCLSIPPNHAYSVRLDPPPRLRRHYDRALGEARAALLDEDVTPVRAAVLHTRLLQIASGAVYAGEGGGYEVLDDTRTELIMDLLQERPASVVAFLWAHQRDELVRAARRRGYAHAVIDGSIADRERTAAVEAFQAGRLKVLFVHPRAVAHGLNLTRGTTTIWASPTYSSELYAQLRHRIYRAGQTQRTETIHVLARGTVDETVYRRLGQKLDALSLLLELVADQTQVA